MPDLLACPSCRAPAIREGVSLRCGCSRYPVIEGIPIFAEWARNRTMTLEQVLAHHLPARPSLAGKIFRRLFSGQARVRQALSAPGTTFIDLAASLGRQGDLDYFRYRFSDLSYLSTSALLTPLTRGPVLDLGCGAGHGIHALLRRIPKALVVGLDLNYSLLYLAKRFVAPQALLVCADASTRLPFLEGAFEAAYSADTFQYLSDRSAAARELLRVARGQILLSHLPPLTLPDPATFAEIFASREGRIHPERRILEAFLERRELDLGHPGPAPGEVVSLSAGVESRIYPGADYFVSGSALNPIYEVVREEGDRLHLRRRFISEKYSEAYRVHETYLPETIAVTQDQISSRDPELVRKFVLLDLPPLYC